MPKLSPFNWNLQNSFTTPMSVKQNANRATVDLLAKLNDEHLARFPGDTDLAARISSYELAGRMPMSIPSLGDLSQESPTTLAAYGANSANTIKAEYARNCLLARRLLEQGVRVVQLFNGAYASGGKLNWDSGGKLNWDSHAEIVQSHGTQSKSRSASSTRSGRSRHDRQSRPHGTRAPRSRRIASIK